MKTNSTVAFLVEPLTANLAWYFKQVSQFSQYCLRILMVFATLTLAACGGGGSLTQDGDNALGNQDPDVPEPPPTYSINIELLNSEGVSDPTTLISHDQPGSLRATLTLGSTPVEYSLVTFSTQAVGVLDPTLGTAQTDANGVATVVLLPGNIPGAGKAFAEFLQPDGNPITAELTFESAGDEPNSSGNTSVRIALSLKNATTNMPTTTINATNSGLVEALVTGSDGTPVAQRVVNFSTTLGEFRPQIGTALTDDSGHASIILTAGSTEGAAEITAVYEDSSSVLGFYSMGDEVDPNLINADVSFQILDCPDNWDRQLRDISLCTETQNISSSNPGIVYIQVLKSGSTVPLASTLVTATSTIGKISPDTGTAITDDNGIALLDLLAGSDVGAGELAVSAITTTTRKAFEIGAAQVTIALENGLADGEVLSAGATTVIKVSIFDVGGELYLPPLNVEFTSNCSVSTPPDAVLDSSVTSVGGVATATYRASGCSPEDIVTVTVITGGDAITGNIVVPVSAAAIGSIEFIDVSASYITLSGTGGQNRTETSTVQFRVLDENGNPAPQKEVTFELSTEVGNISISPTTAQSNNDGLVQTVVRAGTMPGAVRVLAYVTPTDSDPNAQDNRISAVSDILIISTGLPDNNSFSLSAGPLNVEGLNDDGEIIDVIVMLADHFNNPVPDGTAVYFTTEGGSIESGCNTANGICSVEWRSQNPRPFTQDGGGRYNNTIAHRCDTYFGSIAPCSAGMIYPEGHARAGQVWRPLGGRVTVLAHAIGEESFTDLNSNGVFDAGEYYQGYDLSEAFIDHNENNSFDGISCDDASNPCDPANSEGGEFEEYVDFNVNGMFDGPDGLYNGYLCTSEAQNTGHCKWEALHVRRNLVLVMSGSTAYMRVVTGLNAGTCDSYRPTDASDVTFDSLILEGSQVSTECDINQVDLSVVTDSNGADIGVNTINMAVRISDIFNNPMPAGTVINITSNNGELTGSLSTTIGSTNTLVPIMMGFTLSREGEGNQRRTGSLTITATTPGGIVSSHSITVLDDR